MYVVQISDTIARIELVLCVAGYLMYDIHLQIAPDTGRLSYMDVSMLAQCAGGSSYGLLSCVQPLWASIAEMSVRI